MFALVDIIEEGKSFDILQTEIYELNEKNCTKHILYYKKFKYILYY